jgi:transposase
MGVSRGGMNTKIHAVCDALGNPLRFKLTPGQAADSPELPGLIESLPIEAILADKAYDADSIIAAAQAADIAVVIPSKRNRKVQRALDSVKYRARHLIENLFQRLKVFRRVATRFEKLDERFLGFVHIAGIMKWIH